MPPNFEFLFDEPFDGLAPMEAEAKGYLPGVKLQLADGRVHSVCFYDPVRLAQDLERVGFIAEVGLIVISDVTLEKMNEAVETLVRAGYFDSFRPF